MSAAVRPRAEMRTRASVGPRSADPAGASTFSLRSDCTTSARDRWYASSRARSTTTWISRLASPTRFTAPTPGTVLQAPFHQLVGERRGRLRRQAGALTATETIGIAAGVDALDDGLLDLARQRAADAPPPCRGCPARPPASSTSRCEDDTMLESPSWEVDSMCFTPSTVLIALLDLLRDVALDASRVTRRDTAWSRSRWGTRRSGTGRPSTGGRTSRRARPGRPSSWWRRPAA